MAIDDRRPADARSIRTTTWRGDERVAVLTPVPDRPAPSPGRVAVELASLRSRGVLRVITAALHAPELAPFLANDFTEFDRLHLLRHDLRELPDPPTIPLRRGRLRDRDEIVALDNRAFEGFWALDRDGLREALDATPIRRLRIARDGRDVLAYAVSGRAGAHGYLQRLAVDPVAQGRGLGRALIADALHWLVRGGARHALVNTQEVNERAYALYRSCGFRPEPTGLVVLGRDLDPDQPG